MFLPQSNKLRLFVQVNMSLKYAKIRLNSCDSNSSGLSQSRSSRKTLICSRSSRRRYFPTWETVDVVLEK